MFHGNQFFQPTIKNSNRKAELGRSVWNAHAVPHSFYSSNYFRIHCNFHKNSTKDTTRICVTKVYHRRGQNLNEEWFHWLIDWAKNNNKACVHVRGRAELYMFMAYRLKFWAFFFLVPSLIRHTLECQNILFILEIIGSNFGVYRTVSGWEIRHWQSNHE